MLFDQVLVGGGDGALGLAEVAGVVAVCVVRRRHGCPEGGDVLWSWRCCLVACATGVLWFGLPDLSYQLADVVDLCVVAVLAGLLWSWLGIGPSVVVLDFTEKRRIG